jgi:hypothetical protein
VTVMETNAKFLPTWPDSAANGLGAGAELASGEASPPSPGSDPTMLPDDPTEEQIALLAYQIRLQRQRIYRGKLGRDDIVTFLPRENCHFPEEIDDAKQKFERLMEGEWWLGV